MTNADRTTALADALLAGATRPAEERDDEARDGEARDRNRAPRLVEVGIGERTEIAAAIAGCGATVLAIDVVERSVPDPVSFRVDDLLDRDRECYCGADLFYALRLPPELHDAFVRLATDVDVPAGFTTLGGDPPTVPTNPEQVPGGETIHWLDRAGAGADGRERDR